MTHSPLLQVCDLGVIADLSGQALVQRISFALAARQTLGIVGESGSGKTLTAMAVAGLLPPGLRATGSVQLGGTALSVAQPEVSRTARIGKIGVVFQNPLSALNPRLTVGAQLHEALSPSLRAQKAAGASACLDLLEEVGIANPLRQLVAYPHELSGGQAQRVVIAMALARQPQLLIADEPTTALDVTIQAQILDLIGALQKRHGFAFLLVTHDMAVIRDRADEVLIMAAGRTVEQGPVAALVSKLGTRRPEGRHRASAVDSSQPGHTPSAAPLISARALGKTFGSGTPALLKASLAIQPGQTIGIVGESGSGKTTLARILAGLERQDAGDVAINGRIRPPGQRSSHIQYVFQDPYTSLDPRIPIIESVAEPLLAKGQRHADAIAAAGGFLEEVGLDASLWRSCPIRLSGGQRQRVGIARAIASHPRLLIADEPVAALDAKASDRILQLLADLQARSGMAQLIISHDLAVIARLCSETIVMHRGEIIERGATSEVLAAPRHAYTRELLEAIPGRRVRPGVAHLTPVVL